MEKLNISARLVLAGVFLIAVVLVTALIDLNLHFNMLVVIAIMLVACIIAALIIGK